MSTPTELPIHEVVLKIMYNTSREKPVGLTAADVLWKIDNPEITERYIREVLDWLVRQKRVELYLDKYSLDRYEFLEQRAKSKQEEGHVVIKGGKETFYTKPTKKKAKHLRSSILFLTGILALGYIIYLCVTTQKKYEKIVTQITSDTLLYTQKPILFSKQENNNSTTQRKITKLYTIIDSLQKQQQYRLNTLQKQLNKNINQSISYTNQTLSNVIRFHIIFLLLIILTFFKDKI